MIIMIIIMIIIIIIITISLKTILRNMKFTLHNQWKYIHRFILGRDELSITPEARGTWKNVTFATI